jgi:hypothetical protein
VKVALPGRRGGFVPLNTAWVFDELANPTLATAFVEGRSGGELAATMHLSRAAFASLQTLYEWVSVQSMQYAEQRRSDGAPAAGWVWIRHDHPLSKTFAAYIRRNHPEVSGGSSLGGASAAASLCGT